MQSLQYEILSKHTHTTMQDQKKITTKKQQQTNTDDVQKANSKMMEVCPSLSLIT